MAQVLLSIMIEFKKARKILLDLYNYYMEHSDEVFKEFPRAAVVNKRRMVCDFIAGMTDRYALDQYKMFFEPYERG